MAYDIYRLANMLLKWANYEGDPLTNKRLQVLLYYEQGYHLAYYKKPLFVEKIEAWADGPAIPCIHEKFKSYGNGQIDYDRDMEAVAFKEDGEWGTLRNVFMRFSAYSAAGLTWLTHGETPWQKAYARKNKVISNASLKAFFDEKTKFNVYTSMME